MNKDSNNKLKCRHCHAVFKHRQSKFKHEKNCKLSTDRKKLTCEDCFKEFTKGCTFET